MREPQMEITEAVSKAGDIALASGKVEGSGSGNGGFDVGGGSSREGGGRSGGGGAKGGGVDVSEGGTAWGIHDFTIPATVLFLALVIGIELSFGAFLVTYAASVPPERGGVSQSEADLITTAFWGVFTLGRFAVASASRRVRPAPLLAVHLTVVALSLLMVGERWPSSQR